MLFQSGTQLPRFIFLDRNLRDEVYNEHPFQDRDIDHQDRDTDPQDRDIEYRFAWGRPAQKNLPSPGVIGDVRPTGDIHPTCITSDATVLPNGGYAALSSDNRSQLIARLFVLAATRAANAALASQQVALALQRRDSPDSTDAGVRGAGMRQRLHSESV